MEASHLLMSLQWFQACGHGRKATGMPIPWGTQIAVALAAGSLLAGQAPAQAQNMVDNIIRSQCLKAVNKDVKASGKPAPEGMPEYTCECVVQQIKQKKSIEQAQVICKNSATSKYNL